MEAKIPCGGLIERNDLCLVEVLGFDYKPGAGCGILGLFGAAGISLSYLSLGNGAEGEKNMSFCVRTELMAANRAILEDIRREYAPRLVEVRAPVAILTLYGPHFLDKPALASQALAALCGEGIEVQTVCSSVNSISFVVDTLDRDQTIGCLRRAFSWPE